MEAAEQDLAIAQEKLRLLLGPFAKSRGEAPGQFELHAPFHGRVEQLTASLAARLQQGEGVLDLADTSVVWVSALIHQHDWDTLQLQSGQQIQVKFPALPTQSMSACVRFVGPEVSAETRAVSLVAELSNEDGRLRPGMFAWVELPLGTLRKTLVVPVAAVQRHESVAFVFVAESDNRFRRQDVTIGLETTEYIEIVAGVSAGQPVVHGGAFYLKSELLLEHEDE